MRTSAKLFTLKVKYPDGDLALKKKVTTEMTPYLPKFRTFAVFISAAGH